MSGVATGALESNQLAKCRYVRHELKRANLNKLNQQTHQPANQSINYAYLFGATSGAEAPVGEGGS